MARILIVEDNIMHGRELAGLVQKAGHDAKHVYTLQEASMARQTGQWDLVLLDLVLPDGSGENAAPEFENAGVRTALLAPAGVKPGQDGRKTLQKPVDGDVAVFVSAALSEPVPKKKKAPAANKKIAKTSAAAELDVTAMPAQLPPLKEFKEKMERRYVDALIEQSGGDVAKAVEVAGVSRASYYNLLKKHGLKETADKQANKKAI